MFKLSGETILQLIVNIFTWLVKPERITGFVTAFGALGVGLYNSMIINPIEIYVGTLMSGAIGLFLANQIFQMRWAKISKSRIVEDQSDRLPPMSLATEAQLAGSPIADVRINLFDMVRTRRIIQNKTFERCQIIGPALVRHLGKMGVVTGCTFGASVKVEYARDFIWVVPPERHLIGVVGLENCILRDCLLIDVAFVGTNEEAAVWLQNITQKPESQEAIKT